MHNHGKYFYVLVLLCSLLYGCRSAAPASSSSEETETNSSVIQSAETTSIESQDQENLKSDVTDGSETDNYEAYTGVWSENGISHDQPIKDDAYQLTQAGGSGDKKEQETEDKEQELFEEVYKRYYSNRSQEELLADVQSRKPYLEECSFYNEVQEYMEQIRQVGDISNVVEPLYLTDMKYYSNEDFDEVPPLILHLAKNEIYARHGYIFNNDDLNHYFMGQLWYEPTVNSDQFDQSVFNDYEKTNLKLLAGLDTYQEGKK